MLLKSSRASKALMLFVLGNVVSFLGIPPVSKVLPPNILPAFFSAESGPIVASAQCTSKRIEEEIFFISCGGIY